MRTTALRYLVIVSAALAGGGALVLCPPPNASDMPLSELHALASATDCLGGDANSSRDGRWAVRLLDDENSADSTDDDGDDAPDGVIAAAPHRIDVALNSVLLAHALLVSAYGADFDNRALRGPPAELPDDSSQDSTDDDDDDDAPDALIGAAPIRPIDIHTTFFVHDSPAPAYAADVDADALRGPPSLPLDSPDVTVEQPFFHTLDDRHSFSRAFGGESLRAPP